jgi:hypothetical protein
MPTVAQACLNCQNAETGGKMFKKLSLLLAIFVSSAALADGTLGYSLKLDEGFWRVDINEKEAVREGVLSQMGSRYFLTSYWDGERFNIPFAQNQKDGLDVTYYNETRSLWRGFLYFNFATTINVYKDAKKGTMKFVGKIGDKLDFTYWTDVSKKGKKTAELYWTDYGAKNPVEMSLRFEFTSAKEAGSCKGALFVNTLTEVGKFACKSSGKLMDAFYHSEQDVIAWLVHLLIYPDDGNNGKNKGPLASLLKQGC